MIDYDDEEVLDWSLEPRKKKKKYRVVYRTGRGRYPPKYPPKHFPTGNEVRQSVKGGINNGKRIRQSKRKCL